ncbi:MAG TPA: LysR family transcriptional regulator [Bryobacterales bacterium]|nr:LysR family transcriptional regulator [Bryobacterales bacterium]
MSLENFKIFKDIAQTRRISRGAAMNGISQSAASQLIQHLERDLGVELFDRSKRPLALTEAGKIYYEACRDLLRRYEQAQAEIESLKAEASGSARIACIYSIGLHEMARRTAEFQQLHPKARIHLEYLRPDKVYEAVLTDQTDLGMLSYPSQSRDLKIVPWRQERMILVVYPSHRLAGRDLVEPGELAGERFVSFDEDLAIRKALDRFLRDCGVTVEPVLQFDNIQMIKEAVAIGSGISILPEPTVAEEVKQKRLAAIPFRGASLARPVGIIYRRGKKLSPTAQQFLDFLRSRA